MTKGEIKPKRLLWIHQNFVSPKQVGNSRPMHLIAAMLKRGWSVDVITTNIGYLDESISSHQKLVPTIEQYGLLRIHRLPLTVANSGYRHRVRSYLEFFVRSLWYCRSLAKPDKIFCSSPPLPQVISSILLSVRYGAPLIFEFRDLWPALLVETGLLRPGFLVWFLQWVEALPFHYADRFIGVTPAFAEYATRMGVSTERMIIIPTGADDMFENGSEKERTDWRRQNELTGRTIILYAGSFHAHYGISHTIETARRVHERAPQLMWLFVGDGRERHLVEQATEQYEFIRYLGARPKDELRLIFLGSDIGLHAPSFYAMNRLMYSGKVFDYLAAGLPVVSTADGVTGQLLRTSGGGVVTEDGTPDGLEDTILTIAGIGSGARKRLGLQGQKWVSLYCNANILGERSANWVIGTENTCGRLELVIRLLKSSILAFVDVVRQRSTKAITELEAPESDVLLEKAFDIYMHGSRVDPSVAMDE